VISNSGQNACLAPSSARSLLRDCKRSQTSFSGHKCIKTVWRPCSARTRCGSLSAPQDPLAVGVAASRPKWPLRCQGEDPHSKLAPYLEVSGSASVYEPIAMRVLWWSAYPIWGRGFELGGGVWYSVIVLNCRYNLFVGTKR